MMRCLSKLDLQIRTLRFLMSLTQCNLSTAQGGLIDKLYNSF